jgi:glycosyltransferase involved in cell wall biosynthesis
MKPLISVIIPVYNSEKYLSEALISILNQTYSNLEIIVVDDCSTDRTLNVLENIIDNRIKLVQNGLNLGPANSINNGISISNGEFIAIMHADDISHFDRLAKQCSYLLKNPDVHLIGTSYFEIDENGLLVAEKITASNKRMKERMCLHNVICHPTVMFRKSLKSITPLYLPDLRVNEDYELWLRLLSQGLKLHVLKLPLLYYRIHSMQQSKLKSNTELESFEKLREKFWNEQGKDKRILFLLREFHPINFLKLLIDGVKLNKMEVNYMKGLLHKEIKTNRNEKTLSIYVQILFRSKFRTFDLKTFYRIIFK